MKRNLLLFAALLLACNLVSCNTPGKKDTPVEPTGELVKSIKMVETGEEQYPSVIEFTYDDQKNVSKVVHDFYSEEDDDQIEKREKVVAEMLFTYVADKVTIELKTNGKVEDTATAVVGADGLISRIESTEEDDENTVIEYSDKKISKLTNNSIMEVVESDDAGNEETLRKKMTEVIVPEWSGKTVSKITITETIEGKENESTVTVDEMKYSTVANNANIDFNGIIDSGYGFGQLFGNLGMLTNKIGARTEFLVSAVTATTTYNNTEVPITTRMVENYEYKYTTDKDGKVNKITYTYEELDSDGKVMDENSGTIEITYMN